MKAMIGEDEGFCIQTFMLSYKILKKLRLSKKKVRSMLMKWGV